MREVLCDGFNLVVLYPSDKVGNKTRICIIAIKDKMMGFIWLGLLFLHHVILLKSLLCFILNTLDACWIAVDGWSNSSRFTQVSTYLSWMWCLYTWSLHWSVITMCFSINCKTVIYLPIVCYVFEREASSENYGPGSTFILYKNTKIPCCTSVYFILQFILLSTTMIFDPWK